MSTGFALAAAELQRLMVPDGAAICDPRDAAGPGQTQAAYRLLEDLAFIADNDGDWQSLSVGDEGATEVALLRFADRFDAIFETPLTHAAGGAFVGGMVRPDTFGVPNAQPPVLNVAGCATSRGLAFRKCVGEAAEHLSLLEWGGEALHSASIGDGLGSLEGSPDGVDWGAGLQTITAEQAGLVGLSPSREIQWHAARRLADGRDVLLPADICLRRPVALRQLASVAGSSGCAAGASRDKALLSAMLELVERDAVALWWFGGRPAAIPILTAADEARLTAFVTGFRPEATRGCHHLDLTTDVGIPVIAAVSFDAKGFVGALGFGADLCPVAAARKATLEMTLMELAYEQAIGRAGGGDADNLNPRDVEHLRRAQNYHVHHATPLTNVLGKRHHQSRPATDAKTAIDVCVAHLSQAGMPAFDVDLTRPDIGVPVVRAVAFGLQTMQAELVTPRLLAQKTQTNAQPALADTLPSPA